MESASEFFDTWLKSQQIVVEKWMETASELPQAFWGNEVFSARESSSHADVYREMLDPLKYKEFADKIFGFTPGAVTEQIDQMTKIADAFRRSAEEFGHPWIKALWKNAALPPEIMSGHPELFMNMFQNMFSAFENTIGRTLHVPPIGKDREKLDLMQKTLDHLTVFFKKSTEYQYKIYLTGIQAGEKVLEALAKKATSGNQIGSLNELFDLWMDVNEEEFLQVFRTEEFSRLQGGLLEASLNVRRHFDHLMELHLSEVPVVLRSEMDDLYKTVYDLKRKVRSLDRNMKGMIPQETET